MISEMIQVQKVKWCMKQTSVKGFPKQQNMVSLVGSIPTGGNFIFCWDFFKPLDVNSGYKCKFDHFVKNSNARFHCYQWTKSMSYYSVADYLKLYA